MSKYESPKELPRSQNIINSIKKPVVTLTEFNDTENRLDKNVATRKVKKFTNEINEMAELNTDLMRLIKDEENLIKENMRIISNLEEGLLKQFKA